MISFEFKPCPTCNVSQVLPVTTRKCGTCFREWEFNRMEEIKRKAKLEDMPVKEFIVFDKERWKNTVAESKINRQKTNEFRKQLSKRRFEHKMKTGEQRLEELEDELR